MGRPTDPNSLNQYGVPLHACNGYRQDEHYWAWLGHKRRTGAGGHYDRLRTMRAASGLPA